MNWNNPKAIEARIKRLSREIAEIDDYFYGVNEPDGRELLAGMLARKRDDIVRGSVLQLHTSIEDLVTSLITCEMLEAGPRNHRSKRGKSATALRELLSGTRSLGFAQKTSLAVALRLITSRTQADLLRLNKVRNDCSHNWLLKARRRRGKKPNQKKPPLLRFEGEDLHKVEVLKEFSHHYTAIYIRLFKKYLDFD